jgi:tRNA threonylcarbamoyl adenosine modification protein YjeE
MLKGRHRQMPAFSMPLANETATAALGAMLAQRLRPGDIVGLKGELGSGKTTLARAILRAAAGDPALIVPSPTFTLVEVY